MYTTGILLVNDIWDVGERMNGMFMYGDPIIWGGVGWFVFLGSIIAGFCFWYLHIRNNSQIKEKIESYKGESKKCLTELERVKLQIDWVEEKYKEMTMNIQNDPRLIWDILGTREKQEKKLVNKRKKVIRKLLKRRREIQNKIESYEREIENAEHEIKKNNEKSLSYIKKGKMFILGVLVFLVLDHTSMISAAQEFKKTIVSAWKKETDISERSERKEIIEVDSVLEGTDKGKGVSSDVESSFRENLHYNFILEQRQLNVTMDNEIADIILGKGITEEDSGAYEQFLKECREGKIVEKLTEFTFGEGDVHIEIDSVELDSLLNEIAEDLEKPFFRNIKDRKKIQTQTEWEELAPRSSDQEKIINSRIQVLLMEESKPIRRTVYFQLANDFQRLGNECIIQDKDGNQIYFYFAMSIYSSYCALGYEENGENTYSDEEILNYVKARYKEIVDNGAKGISRDVVNNAEKMYSFLSMD